MKILCAVLILFLSGCGDRYSLDEGRGPNPVGIQTKDALKLPPDYLLRAPEPKKVPAKEIVETEVVETEVLETEKVEKAN